MHHVNSCCYGSMPAAMQTAATLVMKGLHVMQLQLGMFTVVMVSEV